MAAILGALCWVLGSICIPDEKERLFPRRVMKTERKSSV